ncbi:janus kinase and microtubule-interacting protein 1 isoform X2 [Denticeps clupeoides]|uniref:janus kinase and microtubule-interacting protein 1 isoform X2 n=1 Tax=Denticeps clupeoides TaxID=299321 RepID=UPI0010A372EF|nr:janus kinase and microtubule-interacting protein 1-like isoform X2 [Denticeps clupeoides]
MSATTPPTGPPSKKSRGKQEAESLQAANEELKSKLSDIQNELQLERAKVGKLRERVQELRSQRDCEQHKHSVALTELRVKLHEERQREVAVAKEALSRQHEAELGRLARVREAELARLQVQVSALRDGGGVNGELRSAIREEGREEARRSHEAEKLRLTQELQEARSSRRQAEEALANALQADKTKAADLRVAHQAHQDEIQRIKRESERDIRRLMEELRGRDRVIQTLEKDLGVQAGQTQRLLLRREEAERHHGSPKREIAPNLGDSPECPVSQECVDERDSRRFQLKIAELQAVIRKLEDRNTLLSDERNELLKRVREADGQMKQLLEKNRRMSKKNEDLLQTLQRMEDKLKNLSRENAELKERSQSNPQHAILQRPSSLTDLSHAHEQQEVEFLRLQVTEQRSVIDELVQVCHHERDRLLMNRKNRRKGLKLPKRHVVETYFGFDEESVDSETSSLTSFNTDHTPATPDEEPEEVNNSDESFCREEAELRFRQLTREYQALQRAYALLQETAGPLDPERHCRTREHLQTELTGCQARIADLEKSLAEQGQDAKWVEEKQKLIKSNQELRDEIVILKQNELRLHAEVQDSKDQNELLEFRVLELEERERRSPAFNLQISATEKTSSLQLHCHQEGVQDVIIPELVKKLDILGDNGNLRNEEQVTVIQACNVLSMCEKWLKQIDSTEAALTQKMMDLENEKELFSKQKGFLEEELDYRKQALDHAHLRVQELEATLYAVLQQNPDSRQGETLNDRQRAELEEAMESVRRQILRQSRQADSLILQQRMELLHSAQQRIRELEDKIDIQRQQIKEIEEKLLFLFLVFSLAFILWP